MDDKEIQEPENAATAAEAPRPASPEVATGRVRVRYTGDIDNLTVLAQGKRVEFLREAGKAADVTQAQYDELRDHPDTAGRIEKTA